MRWQEPNDVGGWRSMQIVEVVPHPYCPTCFTDRSAAPPSRPGACCLIENSCKPLSENRVAFWSHRRFQRLRGATYLGGSCPRFVYEFGTGRRWGSTTAPQHWRHEGAAGGPRFTSFRSATQHGPAQITGRRRERSKMCDGRRHGVVRVGKRGLAGFWGHERGRVQAAPKHGVHGLAQRSSPYGKHPFQDVRRPAAWGRMRRWLRETRPRLAGG